MRCLLKVWSPDSINLHIDWFPTERLSRAAGNEPGRVPVVVENPMDTAILPHAESYAFFSPWAQKIGRKNEVTIRRHVAMVAWKYLLTTKTSLEGVKTYFPASRIHTIGPTPLLMQAPKKDIACITDAMLEAYNRAVEPKEIQILPGGHFSLLAGDEFEMLVAREIDFLKRTLIE